MIRMMFDNVIDGYPDDFDLSDKLKDEFFLKFDGSKDKILLIISSFPLRDRVLLYKKYGKDYNGVVRSIERNFIYENINPKIKRFVNELGVTREVVYLRDILKEDEEIIFTVSKKCGCYDYLSYLFGSDLKRPAIVPVNAKHKIISKSIQEVLIKEITKYKGLVKVRFIKPFHERFIKYKREDESYSQFVNRINKIIYTCLKKELVEELVKTYKEDMMGILYYGQYLEGDSVHHDKLRRASLTIKYNLKNK